MLNAIVAGRVHLVGIFKVAERTLVRPPAATTASALARRHCRHRLVDGRDRGGLVDELGVHLLLKMLLNKMAQQVRVGLHERAVVAEQTKGPTLFPLLLYPRLLLDDPRFLLDLDLGGDLGECFLYAALQHAQFSYLLQDALLLPATQRGYR